MTSDPERRAESETFKKIDAAFRRGYLAALREAVGDPGAVPNGPMPLTIGSCLEYAIYHSPLSFIRALLKIGANPKPGGPHGVSGARARGDVTDIIELLLSFGADPAVELLLEARADPRLRTRIWEHERTTADLRDL